MSDAVFSFLSGLPANWIVFFASAIPITELRASIPFGILALDMAPLSAYFWGVLGNLLPIPIILFLWPLVYKLFDAIPFTRKLLHKYVDKAQAKGRQIEKQGVIGLMIFVGIPLPVTGVWTGSLIAYLLGFNRLHTIISLAGGAAIAGVIMTLASVGVFQAGNRLGWWPVIIALIVLIVAIFVIYRVAKRRKQ